MCVEKIAKRQDTTMGDTGQCGSSPCLGAMTHLKCSMKSMNANKHTQMLIFAAWHLTTSTRVSAWPLSFKNLTPPKPFTSGFPGSVGQIKMGRRLLGLLVEMPN